MTTNEMLVLRALSKPGARVRVSKGSKTVHRLERQGLVSFYEDGGVRYAAITSDGRYALRKQRERRDAGLKLHRPHSKIKKPAKYVAISGHVFKV